MNYIVITGRLARDPERRETQSGTPLAAFVVAVQRAYAAKGKERETDFIYCKAFNHTGDFVLSHFKKGSPIEVFGSLEVRKYQDETGKNRSITEIIVSNVGFVPSNPRQEEKRFDEVPF